MSSGASEQVPLPEPTGPGHAEQSFEAPPSSEGRRPLSVYGVGGEPDARFSLANERTALAWVRTGLAIVAGGIALTSFAALADLSRFVSVIAAGACFAGAGFAAYAMVMWQRNERALRLRQPLPAPSGLPIVVATVVVLALSLAIYATWEAWR